MHLSLPLSYDGTTVYFLKDLILFFIQEYMNLWTMCWEIDKMLSLHYVVKKE